jgi:hypothetical protein
VTERAGLTADLLGRTSAVVVHPPRSLQARCDLSWWRSRRRVEKFERAVQRVDSGDRAPKRLTDVRIGAFYR